MGLVAEFDIACEGLPLVGVAAAVPEATIVIEMQFNHGDRPPFLVTVTHGSAAPVERALAEPPLLAEKDNGQDTTQAT